jgi:hypothetical protein
MSKLINALQTNDSLTANGAESHSTTGSPLVDLFSTIASMRSRPDKEVLLLWEKAYISNPDLALRILLWLRDPRGGAGERRLFRLIYRSLPKADKIRVMKRVPDIGRWDDLWGTSTTKRMVMPVCDDTAQFIADNIDNNLLCKWLPRHNEGNLLGLVAAKLDVSIISLKQRIVKNTKVVEQQMSARQWSEIKYSAVPSKAMSIYSRSFNKRDPKRFGQYMTKVASGEAKINASVLFPHDVLLSYNKNPVVAVAQWNALPNYYTDENVLVVSDVSGSMGCYSDPQFRPIHASISLAMYCSQRNTGIFKDCFITFSSNPKLQQLSGDFGQRLRQLSQAEWGMSTDLQKVFELILNKAVQNNLTNHDMPSKILIISDMEFNSACRGTNYQTMTSQFESHGYKLPQVVFWNVNGRDKNFQAKISDKGVALVSGYSPSIIPSLFGDLSPEGVMLETIMKDRYIV